MRCYQNTWFTFTIGCWDYHVLPLPGLGGGFNIFHFYPFPKYGEGSHFDSGLILIDFGSQDCDSKLFER